MKVLTQLPVWPASDPWPKSHALGPEHNYAAGAVLFRQGEPITSLFLIESGLVKLVRSTDRAEDLLIALRAPGSLIGVHTAILGERHPVTATTAASSTMRALSLNDFRHLHGSSLSVCAWLLRRQAAEMLDQIQLLGASRTSRLRRLERLLRGFVRAGLITARPEGWRLDLPLKHCEIAQAVGCCPEHVSRLLTEMERNGLLMRRGRTLLLPTGSPLLTPDIVD